MLKSDTYKIEDLQTYNYNDVFIIKQIIGGAAFVLAHDTLRINGEETDVLLVIARGSTTIGEFVGDAFKGPVFGKKRRFLKKYEVYQHIEEFEEKILTQLVKCIAVNK